jgi:transcriptional regulator with XRE-family HTH domain
LKRKKNSTNVFTNDKTTGQKIKKLRTSLNFIQAQVADALGIERSTYACYESGKIQPSLSTLCKLAKVFRVGVVELFDGEKCFSLENKNEYSDTQGFDKNTMKIFELTPNERKIIILSRLISGKGREEVIRIMEEKNKKR